MQTIEGQAEFMSQVQLGRILAHWETTLAGGGISPLAFYDTLEAAIAERQLPAVIISRATWREGGLFSAHREYLRIRCGALIFDLCGFPVGPDLQVAWWLGEAAPGLCELFYELPLIGPFIERACSPVTYYELDTAAHFQRTVHATVLTVLDELTSKRGLRRQAPQVQPPVMREFYERE